VYLSCLSLPVSVSRIAGKDLDEFSSYFWSVGFGTREHLVRFHGMIQILEVFVYIFANLL